MIFSSKKAHNLTRKTTWDTLVSIPLGSCGLGTKIYYFVLWLRQRSVWIWYKTVNDVGLSIHVKSCKSNLGYCLTKRLWNNPKGTQKCLIQMHKVTISLIHKDFCFYLWAATMKLAILYVERMKFSWFVKNNLHRFIKIVCTLTHAYLNEMNGT